ncbi:MAG: HEAT repeat domain-containing protein [Candidatus Omnitrophica bacterium]|nr:HEAT repeat domain-containing protein [Candidatus Omnitrophota bacterium]
MQTKNVYDISYNIARFLGSTFKKAEKSINRIVPAPKKPEAAVKKAAPVEPKPVETKPVKQKSLLSLYEQPLLTKIVKTLFVPPVPVRKDAQTQVKATLKQERPVETHPEAPAAKPVKPALREVGSIGVSFGDRAEQVQAEIFFKDLQSPSRKVRMMAISQLKGLAPGTVVKMMEKLLQSEDDALKIMEKLNVLAALGSAAGIPKQLFRNYMERHSGGVKLAALRAISKYRDEESFQIIAEAMKDKDPETRRQALNCLCWSYKERCMPLTLRALHDGDSKVRKAACQITATLKAKQAVSGLISLLSDTDKEVEAAAALALKKITDEDFGFKANGSERDKTDAIEGWRYWWRENQTKFLK